MTDSSVSNSPDFSKRYWLFMWYRYEADGGMFDFVGSFDTIDQAISYNNPDADWNCGMVFDSASRLNAMVLHAERGWINLA